MPSYLYRGNTEYGYKKSTRSAVSCVYFSTRPAAAGRANMVMGRLCLLSLLTAAGKSQSLGHCHALQISHLKVGWTWSAQGRRHTLPPCITMKNPGYRRHVKIVVIRFKEASSSHITAGVLYPVLGYSVLFSAFRAFFAHFSPIFCAFSVGRGADPAAIRVTFFRETRLGLVKHSLHRLA